MTGKIRRWVWQLWLTGLASLLLAGCAALAVPDGLKVSLSGSQEVPPNTSSASGTGGIRITEDKAVSGGIRVRGMTATAAHIHDAAFGQAGPVIVPLTKTGDDTFSVAPGTRITDEQYADFIAGKLYVNVHSKEYPGGEVRAQLTDTVTVELTGYDEVPSNGSFATGVALFSLAGDRSVYARVTVSGVTPTAVKIHDGMIGPDGTRNLAFDNSRLSGQETRGVYVVGGREPRFRTIGRPILTMVQAPDGSWTTYPGAKLTDLQAASYDIGALYIDVESTVHPKGEIRAQLRSELERVSGGFIMPRTPCGSKC